MIARDSLPVFSLIVCTYKRAQPLLQLLASVKIQSLQPYEILIIDGSPDDLTQKMLVENNFENLIYHKVPPQERGLTKQRNYGIAEVSKSSEVICFLDDDIVLEPSYFSELLKTYRAFPEAIGVGGMIINGTKWERIEGSMPKSSHYFYFDGFRRKESSRFRLRKKLGLDSDVPPGFSPLFSHGRSVGFLPPSGKTYEVEQLMGGVSSFKRNLFEQLQFSTYFEGYGLYEDADFSIRASKIGTLYLNTSAQLSHYHAPDGRPNQYKYGKMVVRNGWYVWRVKNPNPKFIDWLKWHSITWLLIIIRVGNIFSSSERKKALTESAGRIMGWFSLIWDRPKHK